jgi:hypothetical protein
MQLRLLKSSALEHLGRLEAALSEIDSVVAASGKLDPAAFNLDVLHSRQKTIRDALANANRSTQSEKRRHQKDKT